MSSYAKIGGDFVQRLQIALDDVDNKAECVESLIDTLKESFVHILRLASTIAQSKGPVSDLLSKYVDNLHKKLEKVSENIVMAEDPDCVNPTKKQLLAAQKTLMEKIQEKLA